MIDVMRMKGNDWLFKMRLVKKNHLFATIKCVIKIINNY